MESSAPSCPGWDGDSCNYPAQIEGLSRIGASALQTRDLRGAFHTALEFLATTMGYSMGFIAVRDLDEERVTAHDAFGLSEEQRSKAWYRLGEGVTGEVSRTGKPLIIERIGTDGRFLNRTGIREHFAGRDAGFLCVAIPGDGAPLGAIAGLRESRPGHSLGEDLKLFTIIAGMISRQVEAERLHREDEAILAENERLSLAVREQFRPPDLVGRSHAIQEVCALVARIAPTPTTVLILGESGVGKELVARALHDNSPRQKGPFVKFNCAALPENLAESELFGHEAGAFTGAIGRRAGRFERASGGTLFLDEVGELSLAVQAKLLRVLQEKEYERVGGTAVLKADVRILAATNRDLSVMIKEGKFREDLFYRLSIFPLLVPPLRERKTDIPLLANHFINKFAGQLQKPVRRISTQAIDMLMSYHWPGNVRELENTMERSVILSDSGVIQGVDLPPTLQTPQSSGTVHTGRLADRLDTYEKELIIDAIKETNGNLSKAAKILGLTERIMGLRIHKFGIDFRSFRYDRPDKQTLPPPDGPTIGPTGA